MILTFSYHTVARIFLAGIAPLLTKVAYTNIREITYSKQ